jgi:hypothetical protein
VDRAGAPGWTSMQSGRAGPRSTDRP